jgi:hypothetical protein
VKRQIASGDRGCAARRTKPHIDASTQVRVTSNAPACAAAQHTGAVRATRLRPSLKGSLPQCGPPDPPNDSRWGVAVEDGPEEANVGCGGTSSRKLELAHTSPC